MTEKTLNELRIAQAYVKLLCIPEARAEESVSLARIGNCEIRMFQGAQADPEAAPLFWLELFDHGASMSIDGFGCFVIEDAVVVFENFVAQADRLTAACGPGGSDTPS